MEGVKGVCLLAIFLTSLACGKLMPSGSGDDPIGGEEKIQDSFKCEALVPSLLPSGEDDKKRGFKLNLTSFIYSSGSVAMTFEQTYTFKSGETYEETSSRVYPQGTKAYKIETDLILVKVDVKAKEAVAYKKFVLGDSFDMECL